MTVVERDTRTPARQWVLLAAAAAVVFGLDLVTKVLVRSRIGLGDHVGVIPGIDLTHTTNRGIAFGLFPDRQRIVAVVTAVVLCGVAAALVSAANRSTWSMIAAGALAGGAVGNLVDRLARDGVTDFIAIGRWPPFNIADIGIVLGALTLALVLGRPRS